MAIAIRPVIPQLTGFLWCNGNDIEALQYFQKHSSLLLEHVALGPVRFPIP
jgi:hypothetical protein